MVVSGTMPVASVMNEIDQPLNKVDLPEHAIQQAPVTPDAPTLIEKVD